MKAKKYAKVGKKKGRPSFRTPSVFKYQKNLESKVKFVKNRAGKRENNKI